MSDEQKKTTSDGRLAPLEREVRWDFSKGSLGWSKDTQEWMEFIGEFGPTIKPENQELKGRVFDPEEGGTVKTYLGVDELRSIAMACHEAADWLEERARMNT